jgi:hypothetical protein
MCKKTHQGASAGTEYWSSAKSKPTDFDLGSQEYSEMVVFHRSEEVYLTCRLFRQYILKRECTTSIVTYRSKSTVYSE